MKKIIYLSGPSGIAKTKIKDKLENLAPVLGFHFERVIITTSRAIRPNECEGDPWYFSPKVEIEKRALSDPDNYLCIEVRKGEVQGLDLKNEIIEKLKQVDILWCEIHTKWRKRIESWIREYLPEVSFYKIFISPLSEIEILERIREGDKGWPEVIETEMLKRLMLRREAGLDNSSDEKLEQRARGSIEQYGERDEYDCIIVNPQGEESGEWGTEKEFPVGEAARVFNQILAIYKE